jgi:hypothetical protein
VGQPPQIIVDEEPTGQERTIDEYSLLGIEDWKRRQAEG